MTPLRLAPWAAALGVALQIVFGNASAQTLEDIKADLPRIEVTAIRDPALMAYKDVVMMRKVFAQWEKTSIRAGLKVVNTSTGKAPHNLRVSFSADGKTTDIPLRSGFILLDELPASDDPEAEFVSNMRKGTLKMKILLVLHTKNVAQVRMGDVAKAIEVGNDARGQLPWYLRLVVPKFEGASACFADATGTVKIGTSDAKKVLDASPVENCVSFKTTIATDDAAIEFSQNFLYLLLQ